MEAVQVFLVFFGALWFTATWICMVLFARMARRIILGIALLEDIKARVGGKDSGEVSL